MYRKAMRISPVMWHNTKFSPGSQGPAFNVLMKSVDSWRAA